MFNFMERLSDFIWNFNKIAIGSVVALGIIKFAIWGYKELKNV